MPDLTDHQRTVLAYIVRVYAAGDSLPSLRELCTRFGWASTVSAHDVILALTKKGALRSRTDGRTKRSRGYGLVLTHPDVYALLERRRSA